MISLSRPFFTPVAILFRQSSGGFVVGFLPFVQSVASCMRTVHCRLSTCLDHVAMWPATAVVGASCGIAGR